MSESKNEKLEQILNELKNKDKNQSAEELLLSKLSDEQSKKLKSIISHDEAVRNFLSSEQAQKIIKQLTSKE
jgi:cytochrome c553